MASSAAIPTRRRFLGAAITCMAVAACERKTKFSSVDVTGMKYPPSFRVTDHHGKARTLADFHGKVVMLFFGFTQCPDVCPTALSTMADVMKRLGPDAARVQVIFMTVDPERDTQELLAQYVPAFNPDFLGVRTSLASTDLIVREFGAFYRKVPGKTADNYTIDHSTFTYVFGPNGDPRLMVLHAMQPETIVSDIRMLLLGK